MPTNTRDRAAGAVAPSSVPSSSPASTPHTSDAAPSFADLGVPTALVHELTRLGLVEAFPIQASTLPDTLQGRDVLGRGRTGSGKTIAFTIPLVAALASSRRRRQPLRPRGLVLVPTRELANQVRAALEPLARTQGLRTTTVFGGVPQGKQVSALRAGMDVVVACPGRLEDLVGQGLCDLSAVEVTVLDEADHMADLGFLPGVKRLLDATPSGQRMLFSATLDRGVDVLVRRYLDNPVTHSVDTATAEVPAMDHHLFHLDATDKKDVIRELASGVGRSVLFTRTRHAAKRLARQLTDAGIPTAELHGDLTQRARERNLEAFSSGRVRVLTATDIAARGIHVDEIELVVHVDPPAEHKAYLHRSGRTARAGRAGAVVTLATPNQRREVATMLRKAAIKATTRTVRPGSEPVATLAGAVADHVPPAASPLRTPPASHPGRRPGPSGGRNRSGGRGKGAGNGRRRGRPAQRRPGA